MAPGSQNYKNKYIYRIERKLRAIDKLKCTCPTDFPEYKQQSLYYGVPYGKALLIKVKKEESQAKGTTYCTIMASTPCIKVPYFSSDETEPINIDGYWQNFGNKEYSNAKWIRDNRYALASRRDESVKCETVLGTSKKVWYIVNKVHIFSLKFK